MVPRLTEMVSGATGEMSSPPKAGDELTAATGGGATVVDGEPDVLAEGSDPDVLSTIEVPAGLAPPVVWTATKPADEPEQAAVAARTPPTTKEMAARRAAL